MEYLLKASAVIALFYCCYKFLLNRETFFKSNRWFLLTGLITSLCIPFLIIPIYIEYTPQPIQDIVYSGPITITETVSTVNSIDMFAILNVLYFVGVIVFLGKLCIEFTSLLTLIRRHTPIKKGNYVYIETEEDVAPFSFFNWIIYNPNQFQLHELQHIIAHEKVHAVQYHSIDVILNQILCIVFWFNPFIWLYKKDLQQNLEFIADQNAQRVSDCDKSYQLVLLKSSVPEHQFILSNNFYNSLIKKRIIMLHKSKSNKLNALKYLFIIPALALFLMSFNTKEIFIEKGDALLEENTTKAISPIEEINLVYDQLASNTEEEELPAPENKEETDKKKKTNVAPAMASSGIKAMSVKNAVTASDPVIVEELIAHDDNIEMILITKDAKDADLERVKEDLKSKGITVKFKNIKRNKSGEITSIKVNLNSKNSNANYNISSDEAINPIKISFGENGDNLSIGNAHLVHSGDNSFHYKTKKGKHTIHRTGKGNNVFVISDDEHEHDDEHEVHEDIIIKRNHGKGSSKHIIKGKKYEVISGDDDEKIEIIIDGDRDHDNEEEDIFIINGTKGKGKTIWTHDDKNEITIKTIGKGNSFFISGDENEKPLFIIDGKEVSKKEMENLESDSIETIEVIKGDAAIEKYGKKAKDGVVLITTKKKN